MRRGLALPVLEATVVSEWVDYNGHMNDAAYAIMFSRSVDALMDRVGLDAAARKRTGQSLFTLQMMLHYFKEAKEGDTVAVSCHILEHDDKRLRVWLDMTAPGGERLAASEQLLISVALGEAGSRAAPWVPETKAALDALARPRAACRTRPRRAPASRSSGRAEDEPRAQRKPSRPQRNQSGTQRNQNAVFVPFQLLKSKSRSNLLCSCRIGRSSRPAPRGGDGSAFGIPVVVVRL